MEQNQTIIHSIDSPQKTSNSAGVLGVFIIIIAILAGVGTGYGIRALTKNATIPGLKQTTSSTKTSTGTETLQSSAGIKDEKTFSDKAEGILRDGGIEGEGAFHLERPGGPDQYAYLTSTTVDLAPYVGKKVQVLGKTFQGKKAGWLMDIGYVEVLQ